MAEVNLLSLIPTELFIIAVVTYIIIEVLKSTKKVPDWTLPIVAWMVAIILTIIYTAIILSKGFSSTTIVNGIIYGIIIAAVAVYSNQFVKQIGKRSEK